VSTNENHHKKLVEFLAEQFAKTAGYSCVRVSLSMGPRGQRGTPLRAWNRDGEPELFESLARIEEFARAILDIAHNEAQTHGQGQHRFVVATEQHLGGGARHAFAMTVDPEDDLDIIPEQANAQGANQSADAPHGVDDQSAPGPRHDADPVVPAPDRSPLRREPPALRGTGAHDERARAGPRRARRADDRDVFGCGRRRAQGPRPCARSCSSPRSHCPA
jgi:hypothetical protein